MAVNGCVVVEVKVCGDRCGKTSIYIYICFGDIGGNVLEVVVVVVVEMLVCN